MSKVDEFGFEAASFEDALKRVQGAAQLCSFFFCGSEI